MLSMGLSPPFTDFACFSLICFAGRFLIPFVDFFVFVVGILPPFSSWIVVRAWSCFRLQYRAPANEEQTDPALPRHPRLARVRDVVAFGPCRRIRSRRRRRDPDVHLRVDREEFRAKPAVQGVEGGCPAVHRGG